MNQKILIIGHTFPEPSTTAAGSRMMQLIEIFQEENYDITFVSTAVLSERTANLKAINISVKNILLNDGSFDVFIKALNPKIVIFDRYITEEQFGWRVSESCPEALKILDTQDLHFLRKAREEVVKENKPIIEANLFSETAKRELASILRCDLSLIISEVEMRLLQETFKICSEILYYLPFIVGTHSVEKTIPSFHQRQNFLAIGNLLHAPNVDSVFQLKELWKEIKQQLPRSELHIYGNYAPQKIFQLNNKSEGFIIKGWAPHIETLFANYRVQLAPLRFGAGLKGKLFDAMRFGLPSVTTPVGAEGLNGQFPFGGNIALSKDDFIQNALRLYSDEEPWLEAQQNGFTIIKNRFQNKDFSEAFKNQIRVIYSNLINHRQAHFIGQVLQHHTLQSSKYLARWIEAKNSQIQNASPICFQNTDEVREEYK